jgi:hypothetical protein
MLIADPLQRFTCGDGHQPGRPITSALLVAHHNHMMFGCTLDAFPADKIHPGPNSLLAWRFF